MPAVQAVAARSFSCNEGACLADVGVASVVGVRARRIDGGPPSPGGSVC
jgi:hypothetical protein